MRRFRFRLESVLQHRETLEGMREQEFGAAQSRLQAEQVRMDRLRAEFDLCVAERPGGAQGERFNAHIIYDRERYLETLQAALEQQSRRVEAAAVTAEERRVALVEARQAREAVSRLREQELAAYTALSLKHEQETLDEQATLRFVRAAEAAAAQTRGTVSAADVPTPNTQHPLFGGPHDKQQYQRSDGTRAGDREPPWHDRRTGDHAAGGDTRRKRGALNAGRKSCDRQPSF